MIENTGEEVRPKGEREWVKKGWWDEEWKEGKEKIKKYVRKFRKVGIDKKE